MTQPSLQFSKEDVRRKSNLREAISWLNDHCVRKGSDIRDFFTNEEILKLIQMLKPNLKRK